MSARRIAVWIALFFALTPLAAFAADRPSLPPDAKRPLPVRLALRVLNIAELNQVAGKARLALEITLRWTDSRVAYDELKVGAPRVDRIGPEAEDYVKGIWTPGLTIENQISPTQTRTLAISTYATGDVTMVDRFEADFRIAPDMSGFPFDRQSVPLTFYLRHYAKADAALVVSEADRNLSTLPVTMTALNWRALGLSFAYEHAKGWNARDYQGVEATIRLERLSNRFLLRILVPIGAALLISIFVMWMPGLSSKDKGGLVVSALLALTALSFTFENSFPGSISLNSPVAKIISLAYLYLMLVLLADSLLGGPSENAASRYRGLAGELRRQLRWAMPAIMLVLCADILLRSAAV